MREEDSLRELIKAVWTLCDVVSRTVPNDEEQGLLFEALRDVRGHVLQSQKSIDAIQ